MADGAPNIPTPDENPFDQMIKENQTGAPVADPLGAPQVPPPGGDDQQQPPNPFDALIGGAQVAPRVSVTGTFGRALGQGAAPAAGGLVGAEVGGAAGAEGLGALGAAAGTAIAPGAGTTVGGVVGGALGAIGGGIIGGFGGASTVQAAQDWALSKLPESWQETLGVDEGTKELDATLNPKASFIGSMTPYVLTLRPGGFTGASEAAQEGMTTFQKIISNPITSRLFGGAAMGGMELGQEHVEGAPTDWSRVAIATGFGMVFNKPNALGQKISAFSEALNPLHGLAAYTQDYFKARYPDAFKAGDVVPPPPPVPSPTLAEGGDSGTIGAGINEDVHMGTEEQNPTAKMIAQQKLRDEQAALGTTPDPRANLHAVARHLDPDTFSQYDELTAHQAAFRQWLNEFSNPQDEHIAEAQTAVDDLQAKYTQHVADANGYDSGAEARRMRAQMRDAQRQVDAMQARKDTFGTPDYVEPPEAAVVRQRLQQIDYALRDLAPAVNSAYKRAAEYTGDEMHPPPAAEQAPPAEETIPGTTEPVTAEAAPGAPDAAKQRTLEEQMAYIVQTTTRKLMAAGQPADVAEASARILAARVATRSAAFGGKIGTPEEIYDRDSSDLRASVQRRKIAAPSPEPVKPAAAAPTEYTADQLRARFQDASGAVDMKEAGAAIAKEAHDALTQGKKVTIFADGKPVEITSVTNGTMRDAQGQPWGSAPLMMQLDKNAPSMRIENRAFEPVAPELKPADLELAQEGELNQAAGGAFGEDDRISTIIPWGKGLEDPAHLGNEGVVGLDTSKASTDAYEKNADLVRSYPGIASAEGETADQTVEGFINHVKANLLALHDSVPANIRERSKLWYDGANAIARGWADTVGKPPRAIAGVLAALSPQKDWFTNVDLARRVVSTIMKHSDTETSPQMKTYAEGYIAALEKAGKTEPAAEARDALNRFQGKTLGDFKDPLDRAMWIRWFDEAHNAPYYPIVTPEGRFADLAQTMKGEPQRKAWGGFGEISKAVASFDDPSRENISRQMGNNHKVRNFYNNIISPQANHGDVTIDTHAVAAALMRPLSGADIEVGHGLGTKGSKDASTGSKGLYGVHAEAYRRAAAERGILPREMQSITWEAVRGLFTAEQKRNPALVGKIEDIWNGYKAGNIDFPEAQRQVVEAAGGVNPPEWFRPDLGPDDQATDAPDAGQLYRDELGAGRPAPVDTGAGGPDSGAPAGAGAPGSEVGEGSSPAAARAAEQASAGGQQPLEGLPQKPFHFSDGTTFVPGPDARARGAAEAYTAEAGIPYKPPQTYAKVDPERAERIARAFEEMKHDPDDPKVKASYAAMIRETVAQWRQIEATGLKIDFIAPDQADPYVDGPMMVQHDVRENNHMWVFPTESGFGSSDADIAGNPLLGKTGVILGGVDRPANDLFRIVHDYFGHIKEGNGFRANGEENAWRSHAAMYSDEARPAMTTETRGQNSWVNYGPHGEANRTAKTGETVFADQKIGLLPDWVMEEGAGDPPVREFNQEAPREYPMADRGEWHGNGDYLARGGMLHSMTPQEFLDKAPPLKMDEESRENVDLLKQHILDGKTLDPLALYEPGGPGADHDGRHRAIAAQELGIGEVPVVNFREADQAREFEQTINGKIGFEGRVKPLITMMTGNADASTFMHESSHEWLEQMLKDADHPDATDQQRADAAIVRKWLGAQEDWKGRTDERNSARQNTIHHENFARGFEQYLMEGRAPSKGLADVFAKFKNWMVQIYKAAVDSRLPINDDIRAVFDRLLASEPEHTVITPEPHDLGHTLSSLHALDAEHADPAEASAVAERINAEKSRYIEGLPPNIAAEIQGVLDRHAAAAAAAPAAGATGEGAGGPQQVVEGSGGPEPVGAGGERGEADQPVVGGRNAGSAEGGGLPGGSEPAAGGPSAGSAGSGSVASGPVPVKDAGNGLDTHKSPIFADADDSPFVDKAGNIRLDNLTTNQDVAQVIREAAEKNNDFLGDRNGPMTDGQVRDLAEALGMTYEDLLKRNRGDAFNAVQVWAARGLLIKSAEDVLAKMKAVKAGASDENLIAYAIARDRHVMIQGQIAGITAEAGRALRAFRDMTSEGGSPIAAAAQLIKQTTGKELFQLRMEAKLGAGLDTPMKISKFLTDTQKRSFGSMLLEYFVNSLISGPITHITYGIGNTLLGLQKAGPETAVAAATGALRNVLGRKGDTVRLGEVGAQLAGLKQFWPAVHAGLKAFESGVTTLLPGETMKDLTPAQRARLQGWAAGQRGAGTTPFEPGSELVQPGILNEAATFHDAMGQAFGMVRGIRDGFLAGAKLLAAGGEAGAPLIGFQRSALGAIPDIAVKGVNVSPVLSGALTAASNLAGIHLAIPAGGTEVRVPGRFIAAIHSFFRSINYSMEKNAIAYRTAASEGHVGPAFDQRIAQLRQNPTPEAMQASRNEATNLTLMGPPGEFIRKLQGLVNAKTNLPLLGETQLLKFVDPFVNIAANIMNQSLMQRTPLGLLSSTIRNDLLGNTHRAALTQSAAELAGKKTVATAPGATAADIQAHADAQVRHNALQESANVAQDRATARMVTGTAMAIAFGSLAAEGYITGSGPSDPDKAAMWRLAGNQAHSVKIGDNWYDVHRLGPLGMLVGVAADMYDVAHSADHGQFLQAAVQFHHAIMQNILDESFMKGPADLIQAIEDPTRYGPSYLKNMAGSFLPYSVGTQQVNRMIDPTTRMARTMMDGIRAKVPGLSEQLMPRRDIWGQPMANESVPGTAIYQKQISTDPVNQEMVRLGMGPGPVPKKIRNIPLDDLQYDDFSRIAGTTAKMRLDTIVNSPQWKTVPDDYKRQIIDESIKYSRNAARELMLMKNPQIAAQAHTLKAQKYETPEDGE